MLVGRVAMIIAVLASHGLLWLMLRKRTQEISRMLQLLEYMTKNQLTFSPIIEQMLEVVTETRESKAAREQIAANVEKICQRLDIK